MKKNFGPVVLPAMSVLITVAAVLFTWLSSAAPQPAQAAGSAGSAPAGWAVEPVNVSRDGLYDNTSWIAASPAGAVTIGWEKRDTVGQGDNWIFQGSNAALLGGITRNAVDHSDYMSSGNVRAGADGAGNRYLVWYKQDGSTTCDRYAIVGPTGQVIQGATDIPGTCDYWYKTTALYVSPAGDMHVILGRDGSGSNYNLGSVNYYHRSPAGVWDAPERISGGGGEFQPAIAVNTEGQVMAAWSGGSPGLYNDIYTGLRVAPGEWLKENISYNCCTGCPGTSHTYLPSIAPDNTGGFRITWADEVCDPSRSDPRTTDQYYREWVQGTGWNNQPLVRIVRDGGEEYFSAIAVDASNKSHIVVTTDADRSFHNYTLYYLVGEGVTFSPPSRFIEAWQGGSYTKEPSLARSPGYLHLSFNSERDGNKEVYYDWRDITEGPPPPTATPTATATPIPPRCPDQRFTDVCPGDYFYTATLSLVDAGVISGYGDVGHCGSNQAIPCFLPFNNVTRAQAAKIIALGANLPLNRQGGPHFTDVPSDNPFYDYVESAYNFGVIGGYPCGGPGEPCDPENRPYFRPGGNVTRGQLSKMLSIAFQFNESVPPTQQTFTDVAINSTFWQYVERMAARGLISGYPCGGPNEPCDPQNRPYFRPGNNMIRGQVVKVVYGAREQVSQATPTAVAATVTAVPGTVTPIPPTETAVPVTETETPVPATATATTIAALIAP